MSNVVTTALILVASSLSILATSLGPIKSYLLFFLGLLGIVMTSYVIFALHFASYRALLHLVILICLSMIGYLICKKYLTKDR